MSEYDQDESAHGQPSRKYSNTSAEVSGDDFQDANDTTSIEKPPVEVVARSRSLTKRNSSSGKSATPDGLNSPPPVPSITKEAYDTKNTLGEPKDDLDGAPEEQIEAEKENVKQPSSPLLTSHRMSNTSLDNVDLDENGLTQNASTENPLLQSSKDSKPHLPPKPLKGPLQGFTGALPPVSWSPPPPPPPLHPTSHPAPPSRKLTSPFAWLSRNTSQAKETVTSPPLQSPDKGRRNTASSIATMSSNPDMNALNKLEHFPEAELVNGSKRPTRNSLRDRFKLARLREEAGITTLPEDDKGGLAGFIGRGSASLGLGLNLAISSNVDDKDLSHAAHSPLSAQPPSPNPALAPGTAAGVSAGPSAIDVSVDWDLWQAVVDEGPAAVARTSSDELNRAIASGIPNVIRGVVWQILAQSKNEELESVYRELVNRGTDKDKDKDKDRMSGSSGTQSAFSNGTLKDDAPVMSSASSIHSDHSSPSTTMNGLRSPSPPKDPDVLAKAQAVALALKKKKAKEDAASLLKLEKAIKRDLGARTSFSKFAASAGMQESLFGVCKAYALFDEGVGYAQGMTFLVSPLLFNLPEEEAFGLLVRLMNQYHLRDLFIQDMPGLHKQLYQFERLLEDFEPALYCHLHRRGVTPHLYATQWFLTLFSYRFPLQLVLRIYDLILSEGLEAILKFGIVLMQKNATTLLTMNDMVALTNFLKDRLFDVYIDQAPSAGSILESGFFGSSGASIDKEVYRADQLIQDACAVKITPELLRIYTTEWEEKNRAQKEREGELETLRSSNNALSQKVRRLEERVEEHDSEHAALATELVRTKVENEELKDENESLKGQVRELRIVIEKQPEEVEARLKSEMDRLIRQNQEVHEDNTRLEEEMSQMEKTLVETKMQYAEVNAAHETMTRKFRDMKKALDQD